MTSNGGVTLVRLPAVWKKPFTDVRNSSIVSIRMRLIVLRTIRVGEDPWGAVSPLLIDSLMDFGRVDMSDIDVCSVHHQCGILCEVSNFWVGRE